MKNFARHHSYRYVRFLMFIISISYSCAGNTTSENNSIASKEIVSIQNAWVRPTNPGQEVGAAYMTFLSSQDITLVSVESSVTNNVQIHSMTMQNGIMKMRMLDTLHLTKGKPYKLAPGGFHLMLFDLKNPLKVGDQVDFLLRFKNNNKVEFKQKVKIKVQYSLEDSAENGSNIKLGSNLP